MVSWGSLREGGRSMVGGSGLIHRLAWTRPAFYSPAASSAASSAAHGYCGSFSSKGSSRLLSHCARFSPGSLCRSAVERYPSFLGGDLGVMSANEGVAGLDALGKSMGGVRMMGGGPRTFPGGVTKWQWKRMQEKKARQIEKARLLRERQVYEERRRTELLDASPRVEKPWEDRPPRSPLAPPSAAYDPQIRAMADRFRKDTGEDLWNDEDGPEKSDGLPSRVSARFRPPVASVIPYHGRGAARSRTDGSLPNDSYLDGAPDRFRGAPRTAVANFERNAGASRERQVSLRSMADGRPGSRGVSSGLIGKLDNLSIVRNFSSSSSSSLSAAFIDENPEEGSGRRGKRGVSQVANERRSSQLGLARSGKRVAENPRTRLTEAVAQEAAQQFRHVDSSSTDDENGNGNGNVGVATLSHLSEARFDQFPISPLSIRALHDVMGYQRMTMVQEATFPVILEGRDVLAKAKTGTGKTIAFLLPSIEAILSSRSNRRLEGVVPTQINVLIICPTRELATQAATEARTLMTYHNGLDAQIVIGGTNMNTEASNLQRRPCQILVGTPGRLLDHMTSTGGVRDQLKQLKVLVLDEADRLLDMGFRKDLEKIIKMLPPQRQTLLFSATVPGEVHKVSDVALKKDHSFIDTVGIDTEDTHAKVKQEYVIAPLESQMQVVCSLLEEHVEEEADYKVLVFCTTARLTALMAEFGTKLGFNTLEIHSRKSQAYRTRVSDSFRKASGGIIMFTSDVSARGVDYPDVTLVLQLGIPAGREEYIHRLGRTGRAGKEGRGVLLLAPWEQQFIRALKDLPITEYRDLRISPSTEKKVRATIAAVSRDAKEKAYVAWLGYYNSAKMLNLNKTELVRLANFFVSTLGLDEPPVLMKKTIGMMGLRGVPGLRSS